MLPKTSGNPYLGMNYDITTTRYICTTGATAPNFSAYAIDNAEADFDCDFCVDQYSAGPLAPILALVTEFKTVVLTKDSKVLVK